MAMDQFLAEYYGTTKTASSAQEDYEKQASVELFLKLASEEGIDLNALPDAQVQGLYDTWVKAAAEGHEDEKEEERREAVVEEAKKEHESAKQEKAEKAEKVAEADFLGRVMAHSYVQEMRKIAEESESHEEHKAPLLHRVGERLGRHHTKIEALRSGVGGAMTGMALGALKEMHKAHANPEAAIQSALRHGARGAAVGGALGAGYGALKGKVQQGYTKGMAGAHHSVHSGTFEDEKEKKSSAIDALAAENAVYVAYEGGFDPDEAASKIAAVLTLGPGESEKVAAAADLDTAVGVRALELLELAGYPVQWA